MSFTIDGTKAVCDGIAQDGSGPCRESIVMQGQRTPEGRAQTAQQQGWKVTKYANKIRDENNRVVEDPRSVIYYTYCPRCQ